MIARAASIVALSSLLLAAHDAGRRLPDRVIVTRYANGAVATERHFAGTREEGRHAGWWEDGSARFAFLYRDGRMEGTAREWYRDGHLYRETHYRNGQEEGRQRMWWPDGTLRASYVVHNGRRYGLLGAKGCIAPDSLEADR